MNAIFSYFKDHFIKLQHAGCNHKSRLNVSCCLNFKPSEYNNTPIVLAHHISLTKVTRAGLTVESLW